MYFSGSGREGLVDPAVAILGVLVVEMGLEGVVLVWEMNGGGRRVVSLLVL